MTVSRISAFALLLAAFFTSVSHANGFMGKCMATHKGHNYFISNGNWSKELCFKLARQCTGNKNVTATYFSSSRLITGNPVFVCNEILQQKKSSNTVKSENKNTTKKIKKKKHSVGIFTYPYEIIETQNPNYFGIAGDIGSEKIQMLYDELGPSPEPTIIYDGEVTPEPEQAGNDYYYERLTEIGNAIQEELRDVDGKSSYHHWIPWSFAYERDSIMERATHKSPGIIALTRTFSLKTAYSRQGVMNFWNPLKSHCERLNRVNSKSGNSKQKMLTGICEDFSAELESLYIGVLYKVDLTNDVLTYGLLVSVSAKNPLTNEESFRVRLTARPSAGPQTVHQQALRLNSRSEAASEVWKMKLSGRPNTLTLKLEVSVKRKDRLLPTIPARRQWKRR